MERIYTLAQLYRNKMMGAWLVQSVWRTSNYNFCFAILSTFTTPVISGYRMSWRWHGARQYEPRTL